MYVVVCCWGELNTECCSGLHKCNGFRGNTIASYMCSYLSNVRVQHSDLIDNMHTSFETTSTRVEDNIIKAYSSKKIYKK